MLLAQFNISPMMPTILVGIIGWMSVPFFLAEELSFVKKRQWPR